MNKTSKNEFQVEWHVPYDYEYDVLILLQWVGTSNEWEHEVYIGDNGPAALEFMNKPEFRQRFTSMLDDASDDWKIEDLEIVVRVMAAIPSEYKTD